MDKLICGKYVLTDPVNNPNLIENAAVLVHEDRIVNVGFYDHVISEIDPRSYTIEQFDLVLPGLINSHHHTYAPTVLQVGCPDDFLEPWLLALNRLPPLSVRLVTMISSIRQVKSGVTTLIHSDGPSAPDVYEDILKERLSGFLAVGQRVSFAIGYTDQNNWVYAPDEKFYASIPPDLQRKIQEYQSTSQSYSPVAYENLFHRMMHWVKENAEGKINLLLGPLSPIWCSRESLEMMASLARLFNTGIHTHLLESIYQRQYASQYLGKSLVEYLQDLDILGNRTSLAHSVWLTERDMSILAETGATVVHNPSSNLRLRSGIAPVINMLQKGVKVALGQDANGLDDDDDFFREIRMALKLHFQPGILSPVLELPNLLKIVYQNGARASLWDKKIGKLEPGWQADLIGVSLAQIDAKFPFAGSQHLNIIFQRTKASDVQFVMVAGKEVVRDGKCITCDEKTLLEELEEEILASVSDDLWRTEFVEKVRPYVIKFYEQQPLLLGRPFYQFNGTI